MRWIRTIIGGLLCSPLVFLAFYGEYRWFRVDHRYIGGLLYAGAVLIPLLFIRQKRQVPIYALLSCLVSSLLAETLLPHEPTFFYPLDAYKSVMVILAASSFALVQVYLLVVVGQIRKLPLSRKKTGKEAE